MSKNNIFFFRKNLFVEIKFYVIMFILTNKYNIDIQDPKFDEQTSKTFFICESRNRHFRTLLTRKFWALTIVWLI